MKLVLIAREQWAKVGAFAQSELDSMIARIRGAWGVEHNDDDTHGNVHADTIATGRLTFSGIVTDTVNMAQVDNYNPGELQTAAILRVNGTGSSGTILITGIQVTTEDTGMVLDGRVLVLENYTDTTYIELSCQNTASAPYNRFMLAGNVNASTTRVRIAPRTILLLIYNSLAARWLVHSQSNENIILNYSGSTNDDDFGPAGFVSCGTFNIDKTAASKTISGFSSTSIPSDARKLVTNVGLYTFSILHANTGSLAANRVYCPGQVRYRVNPRETVALYQQNGGGWKLVASGKSDQWVDVTYASGNFTADTGTWTVGSADQVTYCYHIDGNKMTVSFHLNTTTVATSPTQLRIAVPNARTIARTTLCPVIALNAGTQISTAYVQATVGNAYLQVFRDTAGTAWGAATDTTSVRGQITFMVIDASASITEPHSDVAHADVTHSDSAHSDVAHSDVAHSDSHSDAAHSDVIHADVAHVDGSSHSDSHSDNAHSDTAHSDHVHVDLPHSDGESGHQDHEDSSFHTDVPGIHGDAPHSDTAHSDSIHHDTAHSDSHSDTSSHSDAAHRDTAHVDSGHADSHSDTVPHSDITHVDVAHGDTAHSDTIHADVGMHYDTAHVDI